MSVSLFARRVLVALHWVRGDGSARRTARTDCSPGAGWGWREREREGPVRPGEARPGQMRPGAARPGPAGGAAHGRGSARGRVTGAPRPRPRPASWTRPTTRGWAALALPADRQRPRYLLLDYIVVKTHTTKWIGTKSSIKRAKTGARKYKAKQRSRQIL